MAVPWKMFVYGFVDDASPTTTSFATDLTSAVDDLYIGYTLVILGINEVEQISVVSDYDGGSKTLSFSPALPVAPSDSQPFVLLPWGLGGGGPTANVNVVSVASGAIDDDALAADTNTYQMKVVVVQDSATGDDTYMVAFFQNSEPVSGAASVQIQVVKASDGTDLIALDTMSQIGATDWYKYVESANNIEYGAGYVIEVTATVDGASRTWSQPWGINK